MLHNEGSDSTGAIAGNMLFFIDPLTAMKHRWAPVIEGADIIARFVRYSLQLEHKHDSVEELASAYPVI